MRSWCSALLVCGLVAGPALARPGDGLKNLLKDAKTSTTNGATTVTTAKGTKENVSGSINGLFGTNLNVKFTSGPNGTTITLSLGNKADKAPQGPSASQTPTQPPGTTAGAASTSVPPQSQSQGGQGGGVGGGQGGQGGGRVDSSTAETTQTRSAVQASAAASQIPMAAMAFAQAAPVDDAIPPEEFLRLLFESPKDIRLQLTVPRYGYFKGLAYAKGAVNLIGQIRVIGGIVSAGPSGGVSMNQGAMATSNPDVFQGRAKPPVNRYKIVEWKEL